jgi:hypothetical protein
MGLCPRIGGVFIIVEELGGGGELLLYGVLIGTYW